MSEEQIESEIQNEIPQPKKKKYFRYNLRWINKQMKAALSITVMVLLIGLVGMIVSFFHKELTNEGYIIEQVNVPNRLVEAGFSGPLIANRISYALQEIMDITRQQEYSKGYSSNESDIDLSIELIGIGVPVRGIVDLIGDAIGVNRRKRIKADVYFAGSKVIMILKFSGEKPEYVEANNNPNLDVPMKELISKAAERILKFTDDSSLQRYYLNYKIDGEAGIQLAKYRLEKYAGDPRQEAMILADWASVYIRMGKFEPSFAKLEEGFKKDSSVARLHQNRGNWYLFQGKPDEALPNYQQALRLFTPQDRNLDKLLAYNNLGLLYMQKKNFDSALHYYKKILTIDPKFNFAFYNIGITYLHIKKDTATFLQYLDKALGYGMSLDMMDTDPDLEGVRKLQGLQDIRKKYVE